MRAFAAIAIVAALLAPLPAAAEASITSYDAVRGALLSIWEELPLTARNATLTEGAATGYGAYAPAADASFAAGETINVYVEVLGYGFARNADGTQSIKLDADLFLLGKDGVTLARQDKFLSTDLRARGPRLETYLAFTANLSGFAPGDYRLSYRLTDAVSGKVTTFELPITLTAAAE
ncbi:MAG: hypothetical protein ABL879_11035 [Devosia sp.]